MSMLMALWMLCPHHPWGQFQQLLLFSTQPSFSQAAQIVSALAWANRLSLRERQAGSASHETHTRDFEAGRRGQCLLCLLWLLLRLALIP